VQTNKHRDNQPQEINLCLEVLFEQMMLALRWANPIYNIVRSNSGLYVCEISLFPDNNHVHVEPQILTIAGSERWSEKEALESSCQAAISALELEASIFLLDLNYDRRAHAEQYVIKEEHMARSVCFMVWKVVAQWEMMVNEIQICKEYCEQVTANDSNENQPDYVRRVNYNTLRAVTKLHKACLTDLQFAKGYLKNRRT
jgi:hypothetical protein